MRGIRNQSLPIARKEAARKLTRLFCVPRVAVLTVHRVTRIIRVSLELQVKTWSAGWTAKLVCRRRFRKDGTGLLWSAWGACNLQIFVELSSPQNMPRACLQVAKTADEAELKKGAVL